MALGLKFSVFLLFGVAVLVYLQSVSVTDPVTQYCGVACLDHSMDKAISQKH